MKETMTLLTQSDNPIRATAQPSESDANYEASLVLENNLEETQPTRWAVVISTILLHLAPLLALNPAWFNWNAIGVAVFLYWITIGLGISMGFHRMAAHRSFTVPKPIEYFLVMCGTLAGQGSVLG
ncbi:MAG: hypothetical protein LH631_13710, partial [Alkalinema sp. CAN_BIN05]|nr:hypothetical protein [Alkalinema sp. CAN_BIN05]